MKILLDIGATILAAIGAFLIVAKVMALSAFEVGHSTMSGLLVVPAILLIGLFALYMVGHMVKGQSWWWLLAYFLLPLYSWLAYYVAVVRPSFCLQTPNKALNATARKRAAL